MHDNGIVVMLKTIFLKKCMLKYFWMKCNAAVVLADGPAVRGSGRPPAAATSLHRSSGLNSIDLPDSSGGQKSHTGLTGLKSRCQWLAFLGDSFPGLSQLLEAGTFLGS